MPRSLESEYILQLSALEGDDFQNEVSARLGCCFNDFQRVPVNPGDGGLDGLSHGQQRGYCCYGPKRDPIKSAQDLKKELKTKIVAKFQGDLRKICEVVEKHGGLMDEPSPDLKTIFGDSRKLQTVYCVANWFKAHQIIGPLTSAFDRYKAASALRYVEATATVVMWGPEDLASRASIDEHTLFRARSRKLEEIFKQAAPIPDSDVGEFDLKFEDLKRRIQGREKQTGALAQRLKAEWAKAVALDAELSANSPAMHQAMEAARSEAATRAEIRSLSTTEPAELIQQLANELQPRVAQALGAPDSAVVSTVAVGEVARLIGECPLDWRLEQ